MFVGHIPILSLGDVTNETSDFRPGSSLRRHGLWFQHGEKGLFNGGDAQLVVQFSMRLHRDSMGSRGYMMVYPLVNSEFANWKMAHRNNSLSLLNCEIISFHEVVVKTQMVPSDWKIRPSGICHDMEFMRG